MQNKVKFLSTFKLFKFIEKIYMIFTFYTSITGSKTRHIYGEMLLVGLKIATAFLNNYKQL